MNDIHATLWMAMVTVLGAVNPEAAAGAVCGGFFFWSLSPEIPVSTRIWLLIGSVGMGYGMAMPSVVSDGGWGWVVAGFGASLVHVVIVSLRSMVVAGSPVPPWLRSLIELFPWVNRGRDSEGGQ